MMTDPVTVVTAQVEAYNARDLNRFLECYSPDVVVEDAGGKVLMQGRDSMRSMYGQLFAQSPKLNCEVRQRIHVGPYVIDEEAVTGFHLDGFPTDLHAAVAYLVEDNLITRVRLFM